MANVLQFTAISGAKNEDALCYVLELDDTRLLLDCGSFSDYSGENLVQLRRVARQVDAVLLSHPDIAHLGAYALAYSKYGLTCPAYATVPVRNMGRLCMLDVVRSLRSREDFTLFNEQDVRDAFENITPLRFSQPTALAGKHSEIVVTAHAAGHTIGGTVWTIRKGAEQVLYAMDYNHVKEAHLGKTQLLPGKQGQVAKSMTRPMLLITDAYNAQYNLPTRAKRVVSFLESIESVTQRGGNVLIPVDSTARVLELAYVLEQRWAEKRHHRMSHPLFLLGRCARQTLQFAQSMLEWMAEGVTNQFTGTKTNPFELQHVVLVQNMAELDAQMAAIYEDPKIKSKYRPRGAVVLATLEGMSLGFSQELFVRWAEDAQNAVVLPQRGPPGSLARDLFTRWWGHVQTGQAASDPIKLADPITLARSTKISVTVRQRIPLKGAELEEWTRQEAERKEREAARAAMLKRGRTMLDNDDDDTSSTGGSDDEGDGRVGTAGRDEGAGAIGEVDLEMERLRSGQTFDLHVRGRGRVGGLFRQPQSHCMFPFQEKRRRVDEFGETYDLRQYMREFDAHGDEVVRGDGVLNEPVRPGYGALEDDTSDDFDDSVPTKLLSDTRLVNVRCRLAFVDLEGRSDGRSVRNILVQLEPKRVVLVHGSAAATQQLAAYCADPEVAMTKEVYAPGIGEIVNVSSGANAYTVKLTDALLSKVRLAELQGAQLGHVAGRIRYAEDAEEPVLDVDAAALESPWQNPVFVGDAKLSLLRRRLRDAGLAAEFSSDGVLVCSNALAVSRVGGKLRIQGNVSDEFYRLRDVIYRALVVV